MMRTYNLTEDQAITAITTVADFGVTQVVDGKQPRISPSVKVHLRLSLDAVKIYIKQVPTALLAAIS